MSETVIIYNCAFKDLPLIEQVRFLIIEENKRLAPIIKELFNINQEETQ